MASEGKTSAVINPWIVTCAVMLAMFMEVLDTTVVNVSIPHISGNLGATNEEGTWVVTSYLVSNAIILPISGWLAQYFGRKRLLLFCVAGFTLTSALCGAATSLQSLILFRILQGLAGGGLQPLSQAILLETFPPQKHGQAMAAFGVGVVIAPVLGPTLGGWITDNYTWRWIFYMNIPVGLLALVLNQRYVRDPEYMQHNGSKIDAYGIGFLALGLGCLQVALDTGQRKDWWGSRDIRILAILCVLGLLAFVIREFMTKDPVVQLRAFRDRAFAVGAWLHGVVGFVLYASLLLVPLYLQTLLGFPAVQSGLAVSPFGIGALIALPIAGILLNYFDPRKLLVLGFGGGAVSMYMLSRLNLNAGYWDVFWPEIVLGLGTGFMYTPLAAACLSHLPKEEMGNATSIVNLLRNIGGSVGIAMMETVVSRRTQVHHHRLSEHIAFNDVLVRQTLQQLTAYFHRQGADMVTATQRAYGALYLELQQHAAMLAFVEAFWCLCVMCVVVVPSFILLRNSQASLKKESAKAVSGSAETHTSPVLVHI